MNKEQLARELGISKTVYSLVYRETEAIEAACRAEMPRELYGEPWTGKQDALHEDFFKAWANIMGEPVTGLGFGKMRTLFPHYYPTNGSSEAIREVIAQIAAHDNRDEAYVLIVSGEYEGYRAYADSYGLRTVEVDRDLLESDPNKTLMDLLRVEGRFPHFFISQPSSVDGNVWREFENVMKAIDDTNSKYSDVDIQVHLDLCYVGCTNGIEYKINLIPAADSPSSSKS